MALVTVCLIFCSTQSLSWFNYFSFSLLSWFPKWFSSVVVRFFTLYCSRKGTVTQALENPKLRKMQPTLTISWEWLSTWYSWCISAHWWPSLQYFEIGKRNYSVVLLFQAAPMTRDAFSVSTLVVNTCKVKEAVSITAVKTYSGAVDGPGDRDDVRVMVKCVW